MAVIPVTGVGVYHDSDTSRWHFDQLNNQIDCFQSDSKLKDFIASKHSIKLAGFHVPFPEEKSWVDRLSSLHTHVTHTFIFCSELHQQTIDQLIELDNTNTSIFVCGTIDYQFQHAKVYLWMDWFITTSYFYKHVRPDLIQDRHNKPYYFDILLGCSRTHRDFIFNYVNEKRLHNQVVMTYHRRADLDLRLTGQYIFEEEDCTFLQDLYTHTVNPVEYHGHRMSLSQVVPLKIYSQTYYSVVAETNCYNHFNFYTEKIVKPILAGRLFVVFAGKNYLKNLKNLGFKTFDSVIDESYDQLHDDQSRWAMAMQQVEYLIDADPTKIRNQIKDIVKHNQNHMLEFDWYGSFSQQLEQVIARTIAG